MAIKDIRSAAQSLVDYCQREGESADPAIIEGALKVMRDQLTVFRQDRISAMVDAETEEVIWGEV